MSVRLTIPISRPSPSTTGSRWIPRASISAAASPMRARARTTIGGVLMCESTIATSSEVPALRTRLTSLMESTPSTRLVSSESTTATPVTLSSSAAAAASDWPGVARRSSPVVITSPTTP
jgi:hypothetical protein